MGQCQYCEIECALAEPVTGRIKSQLNRCNAMHAEECAAHCVDLEAVEVRALATEVRAITEKFMEYDETAATKMHDILGALLSHIRILHADIKRRDRAAGKTVTA